MKDCKKVFENELKRLEDEITSIKKCIKNLESLSLVKQYIINTEELKSKTDAYIKKKEEYTNYIQNNCKSHLYIVLSVYNDEDYHNSKYFCKLYCIKCNKLLEDIRLNDIKQYKDNIIFIDGNLKLYSYSLTSDKVIEILKDYNTLSKIMSEKDIIEILTGKYSRKHN